MNKKIVWLVLALLTTGLTCAGLGNRVIMKMSGAQLKACTTAFAEFTKRTDETDVKNFTIEICETKATYEVAFIPNFASGEVPKFGGRSKLGREVQYIIDKDKNVVLRTVYGR